MYLFDNPVLQRELLATLRMRRAFALQLFYVSLLAALVWVLWPRQEQVDFASPQTGRRLLNTFFMGQFVIVTLMAPTFAAGSVSGEKERKTYEMLLASPLDPTAVLLGKFLSAMCFLSILIVSSLPLLVLCYPLGGISVTEMFTAYFILLISASTYGLLSIACSTYFRHTAASLVVSYLTILPLAIVTLSLWIALRRQSEHVQLYSVLSLMLPGSFAIWFILIKLIRKRLLYPPDIGSEGKDVLNEQEEQHNTVGLVIQRDHFPDRLLAPAKREDLLPDGSNPVLDKELRSEIFAQGTLMLRIVVQVSMFLAIPFMAWFLFFQPAYAGWYTGYVILFNMLVGPVFCAALVTAERERKTLPLLLTTLLKPHTILSAKLLSGLRISSALTAFLTWPLFLAYLLVEDLRAQWLSFFWFVAIIGTTCLITTLLSLFCSVLFRKTTAALIGSYLVILTLFGGPLAARPLLQITALTDEQIGKYSVSSPLSAAFSVPLHPKDETGTTSPSIPGFPVHIGFFSFYAPVCPVLYLLTHLLFQKRWKIL